MHVGQDHSRVAEEHLTRHECSREHQPRREAKFAVTLLRRRCCYYPGQHYAKVDMLLTLQHGVIGRRFDEMNNLRERERERYTLGSIECLTRSPP